MKPFLIIAAIIAAVVIIMTYAVAIVVTSPFAIISGLNPTRS